MERASSGLASEEIDDIVVVPGPQSPSGRYLCLFDPLDGSSNIDTNGAVGTIFSILRCPEGVETLTSEHFLQPGTAQLAAGFALYGPSTILILDDWQRRERLHARPRVREISS